MNKSYTPDRHPPTQQAPAWTDQAQWVPLLVTDDTEFNGGAFLGEPYRNGVERKIAWKTPKGWLTGTVREKRIVRRS